MPEGHKTHWIAKRHADLFAGQRLRVGSPQGRFRSGAKKINGVMLCGVSAYGKHLFYEFANRRILHVHLGRYGRFREHPVPPPTPVGAVRARLMGDSNATDLSGPTTCEVVDAARKLEVIDRLGPDPLLQGRPADVWKEVKQRDRPIGALLLDQSIIAGVGNIFRAELLFEIEMNPRVLGSELERDQFDRLWRTLRRMMKTGLRHGRIITVAAAEAGKPLASLEDGERFRIYAREECPRCEGPIETFALASRKLYWCPCCQA